MEELEFLIQAAECDGGSFDPVAIRAASSSKAPALGVGREDILDGPCDGVPAALHAQMVEWCAIGNIPITTRKQRFRARLTANTDYGTHQYTQLPSAMATCIRTCHHLVVMSGSGVQQVSLSCRREVEAEVS